MGKSDKTKKQTEEKERKWTIEQEQLLISWAEKASGYAWMHNRSVSLYKKYNLYIAIPASIFGYLAGTTTLLSDNPCDDGSYWIKGFIGITGILSGILSNFQQMFTFKELSEQHRISCLRFLAFFRDISSELSMADEYRTNAIDYITMKRMEMDIMLEQSPTIPDAIIKLFNDKTKSLGTRFHKPEVVNILQTVVPFGTNNKIIRGKRIKNKIRTRELIIKQKYFSQWKGIYLLTKTKKINELSSTQLQLEVANSHMGGSEIKSNLSEIDGNELISDEDTSSSSKDNKSSIEKISEQIEVIQHALPLIEEFSYKNIKLEGNNVINKE